MKDLNRPYSVVTALPDGGIEERFFKMATVALLYRDQQRKKHLKASAFDCTGERPIPMDEAGRL